MTLRVRTTLTLDDDVADKLTKLAQRQRVPFRRVVNDMLRRGLSGQTPRKRKPAAFEVQTFRSAFRAGIDPSKLNQLVDELEVADAPSR